MTLTELKAAVLRELGLLAAGEDADADDVAEVATKYAALHDMLMTKGLVAWTAAADIPEYAETPVILMTACLCLNVFGVGGERAARIQRDGTLDLPAALGGPSLAERMLTKQLAKKYVSHPVRTAYF